MLAKTSSVGSASSAETKRTTSESVPNRENGVPEGRAETGEAEEGRMMNRREVHRAVDRLIDLITRAGISEAETAEVDELIVRLRRQRAKVEGLPHCPHCRAAAEGFLWDSLPETTRQSFVREATELDWLERGLHEGLSQFPPAGNDDDL